MQKAREFHPDLNQHDPAGAQQKFVEISSAYEVCNQSWTFAFKVTTICIVGFEGFHQTLHLWLWVQVSPAFSVLWVDHVTSSAGIPLTLQEITLQGISLAHELLQGTHTVATLVGRTRCGWMRILRCIQCALILEWLTYNREDDDESFMDAAEFSRVFQSMFTNNSFKRPNRQSSNNPFANFESIFTFGGGPAARKRMRDDFAGWYEIVFPEGPGRYRQKQHKSPKKAGNSGKGKEEADDFKSKRTKQKMQAQEFVRKMKEEATKPKKKKESDRSYESSKQSKKGRKQESHREAQGYNNKKSFSSSTRHRRGGRDGY